MNITLMAHDKKKELMVQFCTAYKSILSKHSISATATTGRLVAEATGLPVSLFLSKNQGGHQQIDARIAYNEVDMVILFNDPNDTDPWEDQRMVHTIHLCDTYNVPLATNLASAEMLILGLQRGEEDPAIIPRADAEAVPVQRFAREAPPWLKGRSEQTREGHPPSGQSHIRKREGFAF